MKKLIICILFIFLANSGKAQIDSIPANQFELLGRLNQEVNLPPDCGYFLFVIDINFELIQFQDSTYTDENINVLFVCPEGFGDHFFEIGKTYKILVTTERPTLYGYNSSIDLTDATQQFYWAVQSEKLEE